MYNGKII